MSEIENVKPFCFVLMPFNEELDDIYELGIKQSCLEAGAYCERVDEQIFEGSSILERIYNQISEADIIIADLTDRNPNVFYEVGYAHALQKPTILLTKSAGDIPFDLKHYPHIIHEGKISKILKGKLTTKIQWLIDNKIGKYSYPSNGEFGFNILDKNNDTYKEGVYSMHAIVPNGKKLFVNISGIKWGFPVHQAIPGWKVENFRKVEDNDVRDFKTVRSGNLDLEFILNSGGRIEISVYENESTTPTWTKSITVEK